MTNGSTYYSRCWRMRMVSASALGVLCVLSGCVSPIALHRAVLEYDRTTAKIQAEMLLLNIARAKRREPVHFTAVSSVAATFNFQVTAGWLGRIADNPGTGSATALTLGASASENPTVTIIPVEGEAFARRMLTPLDGNDILFLAAGGLEPSRVLRLLARSYVDTSGERRDLILNNPRHKEEYIRFRRIVLHIASLSLAEALYGRQIVYEKVVPAPYPTDSSATDVAYTVINALKEGYLWQPPVEGGPPVLTQVVKGRRIVTNYDLSDISNDQRRRLHMETKRLPKDSLFFDIRPDGPGGEFPLHGYFLFRSFRQSLHFIARGMSVALEFDVEKDPRTGPILANPARTLAIQETADEPSDALFKVRHAGSWYWIPNLPEDASDEAAWDQIAFRLVNALYNMTVTDISLQPKPSITIAK